MSNLKLPIPENDDARAKQERRSARRTKRKTEDLDRAEQPDRACLTCRHWTQVDESWGECMETLVARERVPPVVWPPRGLEKGTVAARWPDPNGGTMTCTDRTWDAIRAYGKPQQFRTHRTFPACERYTRQQPATQHRGPSLRDRVRGKAA